MKITHFWHLSEVDYTMFTIPLFKCKWIDNKSGVKIDESGMTLVDFRKVGYRDKPLSWHNKHLRFSMLKIPRLNIGLSLFMEKNRLILMKRIWVILILLSLPI